ncbi:MAG: lysoplasmalogenase, partial [Deltaproteobacteria bacterium]|nr:lysoplasmalogenase [Deltaproteobacteria bacterium]
MAEPNLGSMKLPVIFYIVVISLMVGNAFSVLGSPAIDFSGRTMIFSGAL